MTMRRKLTLFGLAAVTTAAAVGFAPVANAQADTGTVTVIHGVPGVTVDVYVNGDLTLEDFAPETVTDALELPATDYTVDIRPADADPASAPIITGSTTLPAGANATLIAHLTADGSPTLGVFVNDTTPTAAGEGRLVVRHTAAAPSVDVLAGGSPVISNLSNPSEQTLNLPAGTVSAAVAAAGTTDPVLGPVDVPVVAGEVTVVYAIGSLEEQSLGALVQTIPVGEDAPSTPGTPDPAPASPAPGGGGSGAGAVPVPAGVPAGDSGLAAEGGSSFPMALGVGVAALALTGFAASSRLAAAQRRG